MLISHVLTVPVWSKNSTIKYLNEEGLPPGLVWENWEGVKEEVKPWFDAKQIGRWLSETPRFPGLFESIHQHLAERAKQTRSPRPQYNKRLKQRHAGALINVNN